MRKILVATIVCVGALSTAHAYNDEVPTEYSEGYLPLDKHLVTTKAIDGSTFEIEDKSQWKVARADRNKVQKWLNGDILQVYPNTQWFRDTKYIMLNARTKEYACVNLFLGPMAGLEHYKRIRAIDFQYGEVLVENENGYRSVWKVPTSQIMKLATWKINHTIIIGSNAPGWLWQDGNDCILINVERNRYVQAKQVE